MILGLLPVLIPRIENLRSSPFHTVFLLYVQVESYQNMLVQRRYFLLPHKAFTKNKRWSGTSSPALLSAWFLKKNISHVIYYYVFTMSYPGFDVTYFENKLNFLIKPFIHMTEKGRSFKKKIESNFHNY